ncbi:hypothetical protein ARMGADRAFT_1089448 [Armillaria gallica]|uniref:Uncharacterized protein n=1 Tax=Armillaria gallica TaxID=47427 RepID=A0A2H3D2U3_ARMGA|nr:hypothetical protein ARMGADRAFT_1089448 [Armillaria gallica]
MESTKSVTFYAPDVAPPPPLVVPLAATDIIILQMPMVWALEPLSRDLKLLAKTLRRTKARFRPYLTETMRDCSGSPACSCSATSAPPLSPSLLPHIDKGKKQQVTTPSPPTPGSMDNWDEESEDEEDKDEDKDSEDSEKVQNEHVIKQPPQSLGLKQLGAELNWSDDSYERLVKHAEKIFLKHMQSDVYWKTQKRAQLHGKHSNVRQVHASKSPFVTITKLGLDAIAQRLCKKKVEKVHTNTAKRTVTAIQEAVSSRPVPQTITVKKKTVNIAQEPTTGSSIPRRAMNVK